MIEALEPALIYLRKEETYHCPDGFVAKTWEEANRHLKDKDEIIRVKCNGKIEFGTFNYKELPELFELRMTIKKNYEKYTLSFYQGRELVMSMAFGENCIDEEKQAEAEEGGPLDGQQTSPVIQPPVGTPENPYHFVDYESEVYFFERDGQMIVLNALYGIGTERAAYWGIRMKAEDFYKAWEECCQ